MKWMIGFLTLLFLIGIVNAVAPPPQNPATEPDVIKVVKITPDAINAGGESTVTVEARVTDFDTLLPDSVTLLRVTEQGELVRNLGRMYDDGTHGDSIKGDNVFTTQIRLNEAAPQAVLLRASVAFRGLLRRRLSAILPLYVKSTSPPDQVFTKIAAALEANDVEGALKFFAPTEKNRDSLTRLGSSGRAKLAASFRQAKFMAASGETRTYQVPWEIKGGRVLQLEVGLGQTATGEWLVLNW